MKIYNSFDNVEYDRNTILTVGTFDGVHKGHRIIINKLLEISANEKLKGMIVTIDPHPQLVLKKEGRKPIKLLTNIGERLWLFEKFGIEYALIIPFTYQFSRTSPEEFVRNFLCEKIGMKKILVGYDHLFGKDREGDKNLLSSLSQELQFGVEAIDPLLLQDNVVSSTKIRNAIESHDIERANVMLGYNYFISGRVIMGEGRGHKLGFPTANVLPPDDNKLIPARGVYFVKAEIKGKYYYGMANIGVRPTFTSDEKPTLEVNFFDFDEDIYELEVTVEFLQFIRQEKKFSGSSELIQQLIIDKEMCMKLIKQYNY
ncbi:MAG: Riboflavin biosynthesis protein [Bacteroidota bacterium]|nr:Riboflavin biosynthesis protein [Bacteroidota bacterium]